MSKTNTKKATSPNEEKKNRTDRFIDGAKDFINFANLGLVVQIYWSIEKGYLLICELCHCITLTCMNKWRDLCTRTQKKKPLRYLLLKLHYFNKTQTITLKPNRPTTSEGGPSSRKPPPPPRPPKRPPLKPPPRPPSRPPLKPPPPRPRPPPLGGLMVQWLSRESE